MDVFVKAKVFAQETASKSSPQFQKFAKLTQDIAEQTAKKSRELVTQASRRADQIKSSVGHFTLPESISAKADQIAAEASKRADQIRSSVVIPEALSAAIGSLQHKKNSFPEDELQRYGVTTDLREFVRELTIDTFKDFPLQDDEINLREDGNEFNIRRDLTPWQERHAVLVLKSVPEISEFRYKLCPRFIKERRFWRVYFVLVHSHIAKYEARADDRPESDLPVQEAGQLSSSLAHDGNEAGPLLQEKSIELVESGKKTNVLDQDLDAYLMGALDNADVESLEADEGFDAEFEQLVNNVELDSDSESEKCKVADEEFDLGI